MHQYSLLQSLIAVSKIVSTMLDQSDSNLKRSLGIVSAYTSVDEEMAVSFCYYTLYIDICMYIPISRLIFLILDIRQHRFLLKYVK